MQVSAKPTNTTPFPIPDANTYPAVCIRIIDLGTQKNGKFNNESRKVKIIWELVGTENVVSDNQPPQPFVSFKEYTASIGEKANLRKDIESWLNRKLTEKELENFDMSMLLGKPAFLGISHTVKGDKTYANVSSVAAPMKGFTVPPAVGEQFIFEIGKGDWKTTFEKLWSNDKAKIVGSPEYAEANQPAQ